MIPKHNLLPVGTMPMPHNAQSTISSQMKISSGGRRRRAPLTEPSNPVAAKTTEASDSTRCRSQVGTSRFGTKSTTQSQSRANQSAGTRTELEEVGFNPRYLEQASQRLAEKTAARRSHAMTALEALGKGHRSWVTSPQPSIMRDWPAVGALPRSRAQVPDQPRSGYRRGPASTATCPRQFRPDHAA